VLEACKARGTRVGAHPSYDDREGFGRREIEVDARTLFNSVLRQLHVLDAIRTKVGWPVTHVKAHGALYHAVHRDQEQAEAFVTALRFVPMGHHRVVVVGQAGGALERAVARAVGVRFLREGFADRAMRADGSLVPRGEPGAVITDLDAVRAQTKALVASGAYDTLCVHGDSPGALAIARAVREVLDA
jgi:UPF0271 protein